MAPAVRVLDKASTSQAVVPLMVFERLRRSCRRNSRGLGIPSLPAIVLVLAGCVGAPVLPDPATPVPPTEIGDEVAARDAWRALVDESEDPYLRALAARRPSD